MFLCRRPSITAVRHQHIRFKTSITQNAHPNLRRPKATSRPNVPIEIRRHAPDTNTSKKLTLSTTSPTDVSSRDGAVAFYDEIPQNDSKIVSGSSSDTDIRNCENALQQKDYRVLTTMLANIVKEPPGDIARQLTLFQSTLASVELDKLPLRIVISMLRFVTEHGGQTSLSEPILDVTTRLSKSVHRSAAQELLQLVMPSLVHRLQAKREHGILAKPTRFVMASFDLLRWILPRSQEKSLEIYKALVNGHHIPTAALQEESGSTETFQALVFASCIRACCYWGWTPLATRFLEDLIKSNDFSKPLITNLILEVMGVLLDNPVKQDLRRCLPLVQLAHPIHPVPDEVIQDLYEHAANFKSGHLFEKLYTFTRTYSTKSHEYPLPQGHSLVWFAEYLSARGNLDLCRGLVTEAFKQDIPIPVYDRPSYVAMVAFSGFRYMIQPLWEKYSRGPDGEIVRGNPKVLVRIIRLLVSVIRKEGERLAVMQTEDPFNLQGHTTIRSNMANLTAFAHKVLQAYLDHHHPLERADHLALTSLARTQFLLGNPVDGFRCFKILMDRNEKPDIVDLNVGVTALAQYNSRAAAGFIATMLHYGLQPTGITFSTVMHQAMLKDDLDLVQELVVHLNELPNARSSFEPFYSLALACVAKRDEDTNQRMGLRLLIVLKMLHLIQYPKHKFLSHPEVGTLLVKASLPHHPQIAFDFWNLITKQILSPQDSEYRLQRQLIADAVENAYVLGNLDDAMKANILSRLYS
ncbi:hypothetical protein B0H34DRAFT_708212 [Crassisporium funariophilum]|nr:hypothetical protein B0H34DRAFT_708212 [Crassisporium funariophilum]